MLMALKMLSNSNRTELKFPEFFSRLISSLKCVNLWHDASEFSDIVVRTVSSQTAVIQPLGTIDLVYCSCLFLIFTSLNVLNNPQLRIIANPMNEIVLLTNEDVPVGPSDLGELQMYQHAKFVWIGLEKKSSKIQTFNENKTNLVRINEDAAYELLMKAQPRYKTLPNFKGKTIRIITMNSSIYSYAGPGCENGNLNSCQGYQLKNVLNACAYLNLTPEIILSFEYGGVYTNGTMTPGLVKDTVKWKGDMGVAGIRYKARQTHFVDQSYPVDFACLRRLVPRPNKKVGHATVLLAPFSKSVWALLGISLMLTSMALTSLSMFTQNDYAQRYRSPLVSMYATLVHFLLLHFPSKFEARGCFTPLFVCLTWFGFLMINSYNAQLTAVFTTPLYDYLDNTLRGLMSRGVKWTELDGLTHHLYNQDDPVEREWCVNYFEMSSSLKERDAKLKRGGYVLVGSTVSNVFFTEWEAPRFKIVKNFEVVDECIARYFPTLLYPPGSPYVFAFDLYLRRLQTGGIKQRDDYKYLMGEKITKKYIPLGVFTLSKHNRTRMHFTLTIKVITIPVVLLIFGYVIAMIVFIVEIKTAKEKNRKRKRRFSKFKQNPPKNLIVTAKI